MKSTDIKITIVHCTDKKVAERNSSRFASSLLRVLLESKNPFEVDAAITALGRLSDPGLRLIEGGAGTPRKTGGAAP